MLGLAFAILNVCILARCDFCEFGTDQLWIVMDGFVGEFIPESAIGRPGECGLGYGKCLDAVSLVMPG